MFPWRGSFQVRLGFGADTTLRAGVTGRGASGNGVLELSLKHMPEHWFTTLTGTFDPESKGYTLFGELGSRNGGDSGAQWKYRASIGVRKTEARMSYRPRVSLGFADVITHHRWGVAFDATARCDKGFVCAQGSRIGFTT